MQRGRVEAGRARTKYTCVEPNTALGVDSISDFLSMLKEMSFRRMLKMSLQDYRMDPLNLSRSRLCL